jgi:hypothetical protein
MEYLEQYANETALEFEALADCIWKFNLSIDDLRSFVVFVYIEIETRLMRLCNLLHTKLSLPIMAKDLRSQGIERYIEYLSKFLNISKSDLLLIEVIKNLGKVRNCIVHTNGFLEESKDNKELNRIIDNELYLTEKTEAIRSEKVDLSP